MRKSENKFNLLSFHLLFSFFIYFLQQIHSSKLIMTLEITVYKQAQKIKNVQFSFLFFFKFPIPRHISNLFLNKASK